MDIPDLIVRSLAEKKDANGDDVLQAIAEEIYSDVSKWEKLEGFFEAGRNYAETYPGPYGPWCQGGGGNTERGLSDQL